MDDNYSVSGSEIRIKHSVQNHWIFLSAAVMHLSFLALFAAFGLYLMVAINIVSVLLYLSGSFVVYKREGQGVYPWIIAMFADVLIHAVMCTVIQGFEVSFYLYPLSCMPVYGYMLFSYCDRPTLVRTSLAMAVITFVCGTLTLGFIDHVGTVYSLTGMRVLTQFQVTVLRSVNVFYTTLTLMAFTLIFYVELIRLLRSLQETNQKLDYTATHDALTGLSNRHSLWRFFDSLEKSGEHYCIMLGDLDDFKKINDTYGHDCGDVVLRSVAKIILDNTAENDMACRWGGEEMLVVMRGERDSCLERLNKIKAEITSLDITDEGRHVRVTMTFGFAVCEEGKLITEDTVEATVTVRPPSHLGIDNLISVVDKRLYTGKRNGKNVIVTE